jgi:hypothetical protein
MDKDELKRAVLDAIRIQGGKATVVQVAKYIWQHHEADLRAPGDRFYTWQYEVRWLANVLRREGRLAPVEDSPRGVWILQT